MWTDLQWLSQTITINDNKCPRFLLHPLWCSAYAQLPVPPSQHTQQWWEAVTGSITQPPKVASSLGLTLACSRCEIWSGCLVREPPLYAVSSVCPQSWVITTVSHHLPVEWARNHWLLAQTCNFCSLCGPCGSIGCLRKSKELIIQANTWELCNENMLQLFFLVWKVVSEFNRLLKDQNKKTSSSVYSNVLLWAQGHCGLTLTFRMK